MILEATWILKYNGVGIYHINSIFEVKDNIQQIHAGPKQEWKNVEMDFPT